MQIQSSLLEWKNEPLDCTNEQMKQKHKDKRWCGGKRRVIGLKLKIPKLEKEAEHTHVI